MQITSIFRLPLGLFVAALVVFGLALTPRQAQPQEGTYPAASEKFTRQELAQMLGPIALYPDKLLSQILMASTYPIEVIEADRWIKRNPGLQGDPLDRALLDKGWDPSVKALCHFPAILSLMSERITETTNLGNAFLAQEAEVMDMIQELRAKARAQGNLVTTAEQQVIVEKETIIIEPADPQVVYVPYYDPFYVYGPWWYPGYLPYYWGPPGVRVSLGVSIWYWPGIHFGFSFGNWCYFDWPRHYIHIHVHERPRFVRHDGWLAKPGRWLHAPVHRRGVAYRDKFTAAKYGQYPQRPGDVRGDIRGFPERGEPAAERSRRDDEGRRIDRGRRMDDNSKVERSRQERQRVERELQKREPQLREPAGRDRQPRQEPPRVESAPRERERGDQQRREVPRIESAPRERGRGDQQRPERPRIERAPPERERPEQERQLRQRTELERRAREAVEREQPQRRRESVFDQGDDGRRERQSSERGRSSRQERRDGSRDRNRGGGGQDSGRDDGGRNRR